jgi:branched-subunit amino acid aminotransferase/4-amino-4-deoxychorismate lyase
MKPQKITETTIFNIVVESNNKRYTPPVQCGLLAGTFREYLVERGEIEEKIIPKKMLETCNQIYCINSVRKWLVGMLLS